MLSAPAPDNSTVDDLTKEFLIESLEGLDRMEHSLAELERRPDDAELIGEVFRAVHTIKGTTGFLGFHRLESLSHAGENLLSQVRDGRVRATGDVFQGLLQLMDGLRNILQLIDAIGDEGKRVEDDDADLIAALRSLQADGGRQRAPDPLDWIRALAPEDIAAIEAACPPPRSAGETGHTSQASPQEAPSSMARRQQAPDEGATSTPLPMAAPVPTAAPQPMAAPPLAAQVRDEDAAWKQTAEARQTASSAAESTLRVDVELLNRMMNLVGELVLTRNRILQTMAEDQGFAALGHRLDTVTAELRESVMKARMQPVGYVFQKFPRMVRDLARTCGRQVRLELEGEETELDKSLLEAVRDPITHAVRNAVDHGIEPPEERLLAGKPREGLLRLGALQQGDHLVIEVSDDGAGISHEKILAAALERNLISPEWSASLTAREVLQLIFLPGFSTAAKVTNISGRGVGMDVVRTNVEKIGGKVELDSEPGVGTRIRMRIPLTLAIIPALVVASGEQSFAVPQSSLSELVHLLPHEAAERIEWVDRAPVYRLRDQLLPLLWLDQLLGLKKNNAPPLAASQAADSRAGEAEGRNGKKIYFPGGEGAASQGLPAGAAERGGGAIYIAVLEGDGRRFGLVVDELLEPEEIVVKPLASVLRQERLFSGATVLGNGTLALILDPTAAAARAGLRKRKTGSDQIAEAAPVACEQEAAEPSFLVFNIGEAHAACSGSAGLLREDCGALDAGSRVALPLETVERIETVPYSRIEFAGGNALLQFRGGALRLCDPSGLLAEIASSDAVETAVSILVCNAPICDDPVCDDPDCTIASASLDGCGEVPPMPQRQRRGMDGAPGSVPTIEGRIDHPVCTHPVCTHPACTPLACNDGQVARLSAQRPMVGLVVRRVLDVISGTLLEPVESAESTGASLPPPEGSAQCVLLNGRVTAIFDLAGARRAGLQGMRSGRATVAPTSAPATKAHAMLAQQEVA